jgi:spore maturation protein SpmA
MAHINDCIPGTGVKILRSGVARVVGKSGVIVEVSRIRRPATGPLKDQVTVDVPGHGEIAVAPADIEVERPA